MSELLLRIQSVLQNATSLLTDIPLWLAVIIVLAPTLLSALTRSPLIISLTAALSVICLVLSAYHDVVAAQPLTILALSAAFLIACMIIHQRHYARTLTNIQERVSHMEEMIAISFAQEHQRLNIFDHDIKESRQAFTEAQETFDRMRKGFFRMRKSAEVMQASQRSLEEAVSLLSSRLDQEAMSGTSDKATETGARRLPFILSSAAQKTSVLE